MDQADYTRAEFRPSTTDAKERSSGSPNRSVNLGPRRHVCDVGATGTNCSGGATPVKMGWVGPDLTLVHGIGSDAAPSIAAAYRVSVVAGVGWACPAQQAGSTYAER
jgi:hypothetical protein